MGRPRVAFCKGCDRHVSECGPLSAIKLCGDCGEARYLENHRGMRDRTGPAWRRWRRAMAASVGGILVDEAEADP